MFLEKFYLADSENERVNTALFDFCTEETEDEWFPISLYQKMQLTELDFSDITIIYGGNGSGKSTLLNTIAEKLQISRMTKLSPTRGFELYNSYCRYQLSPKTNRLPHNSKFLASEDIFSTLLSRRDSNNDIYQLKDEVQQYRTQILYQDGYTYNEDHDIDKLRKFVEARRKTARQYTRDNVETRERQFSNGESAILFFEQQIERNALYLLDEPENSMSPKYQLELKQLLEDCVRFDNCQLIIATHSPFLLSLRGAKIYNLDENPVTVEKWYNLDNVRSYYNFFQQHKDEFED